MCGWYTEKKKKKSIVSNRNKTNKQSSVLKPWTPNKAPAEPSNVGMKVKKKPNKPEKQCCTTLCEVRKIRKEKGKNR